MKKQIAALSIIASAVCGCNPPQHSTAPAVPAAPIAERATWEYKVLDNKRKSETLVQLDELGAEGWELVSVIPETNGYPEAYFFKRRK